MKVISLFALASSAAAFAPAQQRRASTSLAAFEKEVGVQAPVSDNDHSTFEDFYFFATVKENLNNTITFFLNNSWDYGIH